MMNSYVYLSLMSFGVSSQGKRLHSPEQPIQILRFHRKRKLQTRVSLLFSKKATKNMGSGVSSPIKSTGITFESLADLDADAFLLARSTESQRLVFHTLFCGERGYQSAATEQAKNAFAEVIRDNYISAKLDHVGYKSYHTFTHAVDVMLTTHAIIFDTAYLAFTPAERTALVTAALCHDVLHPGVNNLYFVNTKDPLADKYENVGGILERQSIDFTLPLIAKYGIVNPEATQLYIDAIDWTDMSKHGKMMKDMEAFHPDFIKSLNEARKEKGVEEKDSGIDKQDCKAGVNLSNFLTKDQRSSFATLILHCADVSNPVKKWEYCERWAVLVMLEFFGQGDFEKANGLPVSMNCDRESTKTPQCQIGFAMFVIKPLFTLLTKFLPVVGGKYLKQCDINMSKWNALKEAAEASGTDYVLNVQPPTVAGGWLYGNHDDKKKGTEGLSVDAMNSGGGTSD